MTGDRGPDFREFIHPSPGVAGFDSKDCGDDIDATGGSMCLLPPGVATNCGPIGPALAGCELELGPAVDASSLVLKESSKGFGSRSNERRGAGRGKESRDEVLLCSPGFELAELGSSQVFDVELDVEDSC